MTGGFDADVIVIGGGISGLATAWNLQKRGVRVRLLEAGPRAGGTIGSTRAQGCLLEAGPNSTLDTNPLIGKLLDELGIAGERVVASPAAHNRYIMRGGKLIPLPMSPGALLATALFSARAKLRVLGEPFVGRAPAGAEESVADFVRRRLGSEFLDYAINPFVAGVYAGDPELLSVAAAFPRLVEIERAYGSLIVGQVRGAKARARNAEISKQSAAMFAFRDGMQTLTDALAQGLHAIELDAAAVRVAPGNDGHSVTVQGVRGPRELRARAVVLAVPAWVAADLVRPFAPRASAALAEIPYPPVAVATSAYRRDAIAHKLDGFGYLVPQCEHRQVMGTIFSSTLFGERAPRDQVLLTTFVGGMRQPALAQLADSAIAELVAAEHASALGAAQAPAFMNVKRWQRAIPQYTLGHRARIEDVEAVEREHPGIAFCANYRGGVSIGDCIKSAERTARQVAQYLQQR